MTGSAVVVGGGPAGVLLTYLLARGGVAVTLLESRGDFARRYRGDTLAPEVLEYLDELGLADDLLAEVEHTRVTAFRWHTAGRTWTLADPRLASRRFGFYATIPQSVFLPWLAARAQAYGARVEMGARLSSLRSSDAGRVVGVTYTRSAAPVDLDADLVVGADGRSSKVRALAGIEPTELGASLDILWFSVPHRPEDPTMSGLDLVGVRNTTIGVLDQRGDWQLGYMIPAGSFDAVRAGGVRPILDDVGTALPWLADRLPAITDVNEMTLLPVRITTTSTWSRPGLALIGDAAHVISPVGGNGINLALGDAADLANRIVELLRGSPVDGAVLDVAVARVEAVRRPAIEATQHRHAEVERRSLARMRRGDARPPLPLRVVAALMRVPGVGRLLALARRLGVGPTSGRVPVPSPVPAIAEGRGVTPAA